MSLTGENEHGTGGKDSVHAYYSNYTATTQSILSNQPWLLQKFHLDPRGEKLCPNQHKGRGGGGVQGQFLPEPSPDVF